MPERRETFKNVTKCDTVLTARRWPDKKKKPEVPCFSRALGLKLSSC